MARIVVIDDDATVRESLARFLRRLGHEVEEAADGKQASHALTGERIDLVITDISMPEMDGIEVINLIQESGSAVPVIAISGGGLLEKELLLENAEALGAVRVIAKPFDLGEMREAVERVLASRD